MSGEFEFGVADGAQRIGTGQMRLGDGDTDFGVVFVTVQKSFGTFQQCGSDFDANVQITETADDVRVILDVALLTNEAQGRIEQTAGVVQVMLTVGQGLPGNNRLGQGIHGGLLSSRRGAQA